MPEQDYQLHPDGRFILKGYNQKKPFSNFLPGIAGLYGTPMWVFYVNRGQGVVSFGTRSKDNAILEFFPANKAYPIVFSNGFRTFIKRVSCPAAKAVFYEPFSTSSASPLRKSHREQSLEISSHEFSVRERNKDLGLEFMVTYFTVPGELLAALAREVTITNISHEGVRLEVLDGLPAVNPYGMNEFFIKNMSRTIEAWMVTENLAKGAPFFRLKAEAADQPEVVSINEGNFFFGLAADGRKAKLLSPLVDVSKVFGPSGSFLEPASFIETTPFRVFGEQITESRTPCAFNFSVLNLSPGHSKRLRSFYGQARSVEQLNGYVSRAAHPDYFEDKRLENKKCIDGIQSRVFTATASPPFDLYCGQTYLDNVLRGGMPVHLGEGKKGLVFYVYSRKHGDLERDYNRFLVEPSYFSQGDGNYRDVNQNRRNDVWFDPTIGEFNIRKFMNLLQLDGFNPLVTKGECFHLERSAASEKILAKLFGVSPAALLWDFLKKPFSPGQLCRFLEEKKMLPRTKFNALVAQLVGFMAREERTEFGEGYWVDHWTYNLDLVESFLAIFPENRNPLLFEREEYAFHDSDRWVRPRHLKYQIKEAGVRQYQSVGLDKEKTRRIALRPQGAALVRTRWGKGEIYRTTLFVKLICLFAHKFASLDARGIAVEMEADKPSWYDALNGLPALVGSSLPETFELKRLALFMLGSLEDSGKEPDEKIRVPEELYELLRRLDTALNKHFFGPKRSDFSFWDEAAAAREKFRAETLFGLSGKEKAVTLSWLRAFLEHAREKIEAGLCKAFDANTRLYPTYFENRVTRYRVEKSGAVRVLGFEHVPLPWFLEGPVHALKVEKDPARRRELLKAVRASDLYDSKLGMYKVNAPFGNVSLEIGRARIFSPGWLENESIWLHMEYKFMLEILRSGMTEEFFNDFKKVLIPFQPPSRYGRSPLENSSFLVSSAFVDESLHGTGFVARLSGSTAEFIHLWLLMNVGRRPFIVSPEGTLSLRFEPNLPSFLFVNEPTTRLFYSKEGDVSKIHLPKDSLAFLFLGKTLVFYHNPKRLNTYGKVRASVRKITLTPKRGDRVEFKGDTVPNPWAAKVRDEFIPRIDIELG